jgi:hypothetical protein
MNSAWFWGTTMWRDYQSWYHLARPEAESYQTSPLADDDDLYWTSETRDVFLWMTHHTQVLDLTPPLAELWRGIRKSYHSEIHRVDERYTIMVSGRVDDYKALHARANGGQPRHDMTYECQKQWIAEGYGVLIATALPEPVAAAYWIVYEGCAYYMSGPSIEDDVQKSVIWYSIGYLKSHGIRLIELGQIDGETEKERNIGKFKQGFGGKSVPYTIATRRVL